MTVAFSLISVLIVPPPSSFPFLLAVVRMLTYDPGNFCVTLVFFGIIRNVGFIRDSKLVLLFL